MIDGTLRWATDADGERIRAFLSGEGFPIVDEWDWSNITGQGWLLAEVVGELIGCAHLLLSQPVAYVTWLVIAPEYHQRGVCEALGAVMVGEAERAGITHWATVVQDGNPQIQTLLAKRAEAEYPCRAYLFTLARFQPLARKVG